MDRDRGIGIGRGRGEGRGRSRGRLGQQQGQKRGAWTETGNRGVDRSGHGDADGCRLAFDVDRAHCTLTGRHPGGRRQKAPHDWWVGDGVHAQLAAAGGALA